MQNSTEIFMEEIKKDFDDCFPRYKGQLEVTAEENENVRIKFHDTSHVTSWEKLHQNFDPDFYDTENAMVYEKIHAIFIHLVHVWEKETAKEVDGIQE